MWQLWSKFATIKKIFDYTAFHNNVPNYGVAA